MKKDLKKQIEKALKKTNFIEEKNKEILLSSLDEIPDIGLKRILELIEEQNVAVETYIKEAINADPTIAVKMKKKAQNIKAKIHKLEETEEKGSAEEQLEQQLKDL
ncbi:hypothetical protein ACFL2V_04415 [Pseudomonadota bacterium]